MERLTKISAIGIPYTKIPLNESTFIDEPIQGFTGFIADKLYSYEEADEQGRFRVLPCKIGDVVYEVADRQITKMKVGNIYPSGCIVKGKLCNAYLTTDYTYSCVTIWDFGKTVFFTKAEAEQALIERGDNSNE